MVKIRLLGISATPVKDGNCDQLVKFALDSAEAVGDVETRFISTAGKTISACNHCQWCIENLSPCKVQDDMQSIYESIMDSDGILFGSPAWLNTLSPFLLDLFSRARYQLFFTNHFRNKVAGLFSLGFLGFGIEHALDTLRDVVSAMNMIVVAQASALSSSRALGQRPTYMENGVLDDKWGMDTVKKAAVRVVEITRMITYAQEKGIGLPAEYQYTPTGGKVKASNERVFKNGVWRGAED